MIRSIRNYFRSISLEMKKVSWMNRTQIINSTFIVGAFALIISFFLFILDFGLSEFVKILYNLI